MMAFQLNRTLNRQKLRIQCINTENRTSISAYLASDLFIKRLALANMAVSHSDCEDFPAFSGQRV
ncbi:MAG: hypothetical protein AAFN16_12025, partial [Pseudomonadota bacterium]